MVRLGKLKIGESPLLIGVVISQKTIPPKIKEAADILELRIDQFSVTDPSGQEKRAEKVKEFIGRTRRLNLPLIATVRRKEEGGNPGLDEEERLSLFKEVIPLVEGVDIELNAEIREEVVRIARENKKTLILSYHNLSFTPSEEELKKISKSAKEAGADIIKIIPFAKIKEDVIRLLSFIYSSPYKPLVSFSLGEEGRISRLASFLFGSSLSYGYLEKESAEGQLSIWDLRMLTDKLYPQKWNHKITQINTDKELDHKDTETQRKDRANLWF